MIHPPSLSQTTATPAYTLVRLSATSENDDWHQTNLPLPPNPETQEREPRWATEIEQSVQHQLPRSLAFQMIYNPENSVELEDGIDGEDDELDGDDDDDDDDDDDYGSGKVRGNRNGGGGGGGGGDDDDDNDNDLAGMRGLDTSDQVHPTRMRIWGLAASPGKGVTAVFVSPHSTLKPDRITFGGMKCKVLFGRHVGIGRGGGGDGDDGDDGYDLPPPLKNLSTEARVWEWMYGGGPPVPGIGSSTSPGGGGDDDGAPLKRKLADVASSRLCPFCGTAIKPGGDASSSMCVNGHIFGTF